MKLAICMLALGMTALGAQTPVQNPTMASPPAANPAAHIAVTSAIMQKLTNDPVLTGLTITANVTDNGVVSLNGVVSTQALADQAVSDVQGVSGVQSVKSQILINQDPFAAAANAASSGASLPETAGSGSQLLAANDPQVQMAQALAADPALARIAANVYGTTVVLNGTVATKADKQRALAIVHQHLPNYQITDVVWVNRHPLVPLPLTPKASGGAAAAR